MSEQYTKLIEIIGEDPQREGLVKTPDRAFSALMFLTSGYEEDPDEVLNGAIFEDEKCDEMIIVKDIEFYSLCEHHILPFWGQCHVAYVPNGKIVGLSKIPRIVNMFARRLQVQERLTQQIADELTHQLDPKGVGVICEGQHLCMKMRGVEKQNASMITNAMEGVFRTEQACRNEFLSMVNK